MEGTDRSALPGAPGKRLGSFVVFLLFGIVVFAVPAVLPDVAGAVWLTATSVGFLLAFFRFRQKEGPANPLGTLCLPFAAASLVMLLQTVPFALGLAITNRNEFLGWQAVRTLFAVAVIVMFTRLSGEKLGSLYLRKGRLALGLIVGVGAFALLYVTAPQGSGLITGQTVTLDTEIALSAWLIPFVLLNGLREELMFRGLFLQKYQAILGAPVANLLQAIVFSLSHLGEVYTPTLLFFLVETLILGLIWGFLMQKTNSLIGSALFHAGADVPIVVVLLSSFVAPWEPCPR